MIFLSSRRSAGDEDRQLEDGGQRDLPSPQQGRRRDGLKGDGVGERELRIVWVRTEICLFNDAEPNRFNFFRLRLQPVFYTYFQNQHFFPQIMAFLDHHFSSKMVFS